MKDVVVGVDRSDTARRAAEKAKELATALDANLHLVTCAEPSADVDVGIGSDRFHSDWESDAEQFLAGLAKQLGYARTTTAVETGEPGAALCREAKRLEASTIVVGNRRVQGVSRVLGSVASHVLRKAPCDVLVAYTREQPKK